MNQKEAYEKLSQRLGVDVEMFPYVVELFLDHTLINPITPETSLKLGRLTELTPGKTVLDLACGKAGVSLPLVRTYKVRLTGVDLLPDFIREAWSRAEHAGLYENCNFRNMDVAEFVTKAKGRAAWDVVLILGAMTHIWPDVPTALSEISPLIKPGGYLVVGEGYRLPEGEVDPEEPFPTQREIQADLEKAGQVIEVLDDGPAGWDLYLAPQKKQMARLRDKKPDHSLLQAFLDEWERRMNWEAQNLGFAVWVIKTPT